MNWQYDPFHPDFDQNPHEAFRQLREQAPVYYWEKGQSWLVTRHTDVISVMKDRRFSTNPADWRHSKPLPPELMASRFMSLMAHSILGKQGDSHLRLRRLLAPAFTPRSIEQLRPSLQQIVDELLAPFQVGDTIDLTKDFAEKLPVRAISSMLGIPPQHDLNFRRFSYAYLACNDPLLSPEFFARANVDIELGVQMLKELIEERRHNPGTDLLSTLLQLEEQGDRVSSDELLALVASMVSAGTETTTHMICLVIRTLLSHPEQLQMIKSDPSLIAGALDEALRFEHVGKFGPMPRYALEDVEIGGVCIPKGDLVLATLTASCRDEAAFANADRFDIKRDQQNNIPFGIGPRYCIGAALARLEGQIAIGTLIRRFPQMQLAGELQFSPHPFVRQVMSMPLHLGPRPT